MSQPSAQGNSLNVLRMAMHRGFQCPLVVQSTALMCGSSSYSQHGDKSDFHRTFDCMVQHVQAVFQLDRDKICTYPCVQASPGVSENMAKVAAQRQALQQLLHHCSAQLLASQTCPVLVSPLVAPASKFSMRCLSNSSQKPGFGPLPIFHAQCWPCLKSWLISMLLQHPDTGPMSSHDH